nr:kallistatin isoform X2 [Microcebus murinus]
MHLANHLLLLLAALLALSHGHLHPQHKGQGGTNSSHQQVPGTDEGSPSLRIAPGNTNFALRFYHLIASESPKKNIFFSPLSISAALAMLSLGARSHSQTQMLQGLGFNLTELSESDIHGGFQHLLHNLNLPSRELAMHVGSALFLNQDLPFLPKFLNETTAFYESRLFHTDFSDTVGTTQLINNHVKQETQGKIVDLVSKLSTDTLMVLVNYVYFKGKMKELEEVLTPEMLRRWNNLLQKRNFYRKLELHFPKFSISGSYTLHQILPKLGFHDLFSPRANFSGITGQLKLQAPKSFHKATLDVNEAGTQATAATSSSTRFLSAQHSHRVLWFNRPFFLVILSGSTQSVLFLGKVVDPTQP